jgi:xanthine dehydrogenase accessory factor
MAFTDAIFDGKAELEGVFAKRARELTSLTAMMKCTRAISVATNDPEYLIGIIKPDVLIDARMRKRDRPEKQLGLAPLTIGVGPNFVAGETTDVVIETAWGESLGQLIKQGSSLPLSGEPKAIDGHARDRYLYAETEGTFVTSFNIGDNVHKGEPVARIGATTLRAPLTGQVRGLTHDGVRVRKGTKVVEIDPRGPMAIVRGLGERPARIAEGVLEATRTLL